MEVVVANGDIVVASATQNRDLFRALKGGGNQYGIVTQFVLKTYNVGAQIWGGFRTYPQNKTDQVVAAIAKFTSSYPDVKAAIIPTFLSELGPALNVMPGKFFHSHFTAHLSSGT